MPSIPSIPGIPNRLTKKKRKGRTTGVDGQGVRNGVSPGACPTSRASPASPASSASSAGRRMATNFESEVERRRSKYGHGTGASVTQRCRSVPRRRRSGQQTKNKNKKHTGQPPQNPFQARSSRACSSQTVSPNWPSRLKTRHKPYWNVPLGKKNQQYSLRVGINSLKLG